MLLFLYFFDEKFSFTLIFFYHVIKLFCKSSKKAASHFHLAKGSPQPHKIKITLRENKNITHVKMKSAFNEL